MHARQADPHRRKRRAVRAFRCRNEALRFQAGAQIPITRSYNPLNGLQTGLCAGVDSCDLVKELYSWDAAGNLSAQQKEGRYIEVFQYDALNRLTTGTLVIEMLFGVAMRTWQRQCFMSLCMSSKIIAMTEQR